MPFKFSRISIVRVISSLALSFLFYTVPAAAQSTDVRFPTPVGNHEIVGAIGARDIGDARLTDHFYTFNGLPGDLIVTIESTNLNGDFDVFTAAELRPVLKVVVYAESGSAVTKNIYLRKPESMILRVEARTPNDDQGTYRIRFSGTFAPVEGALVADAKPVDETKTLTRPGERKTSRVTSAGARIDEPVEEVATAPTPEPTPAIIEEAPKPRKTAPVRNTRIPRPAPRRTTSKPAATKTTTAETATNKPSSTDETVSTKPVSTVESTDTATPTTTPTTTRATVKKTPGRPARGTSRAVKPRATVENGQLVIEVNDGTRVEYSMNLVAKVTIENGEVVIVLDDGYTRRVPLTSILRMSIGP
jgi:hypothetical protein